MPRAVRVRKTLRREFTQEQIAFCRGVFAAADVVEGGISLSECQELFEKEYGQKRHRCTFSKLRTGKSFKELPKLKRGRKKKTTKEQDKALVEALGTLQKTELGEVTAKVILNFVGLLGVIAPATISRCFRSLNMGWRSVTRKLELTVGDKEKSLEMGNYYAGFTEEFWASKCIYMDNKSWGCRTTEKGRKHALS